MNKLLSDKDKVIMQSQNKLECQESKLYHLQQQIKDLHQQNNDLKNDHNLDTPKINKTILNNNDEIF